MPPAEEPDASLAGASAMPRVVIAGAGFAGLACARALGGARCHVTVVDRRNYHLFQPLLYQVATAALSPAEIAEPIRKILRGHGNIEVRLGEVEGVDRIGRRLLLTGGHALAFDVLVLATGSTYSYFGRDAWAQAAPGLKTLEDARTLRHRLLSSFELAEASSDPDEQQALMTSIVIGGGPTGVEMAGSIAELSRYTLARDFRRINPRQARTILVEAAPRILGGFPEPLARYAQGRLERLGVEVRAACAVEALREGVAVIAGEEIKAGTIVWAAGVRASPVGAWLGLATDRAGRVAVLPSLCLAEDPDIFVLGDAAAAAGEDGRPLPGLAQVANQQGQHLGNALRQRFASGAPVPAFHFHNRGNTAIIGRHAAIFDFGRHQLRGWPAWILWAIVHVYLLIGFEKRLLVSIQWLWRYLTYERGARLISEPQQSEPHAHQRGG